MSTFLEKNKKKSALAALLLLLRRRKAVTALLLVVALASLLVIGSFVNLPNGARVVAGAACMLANLPGGARAAAGAAWLVGKLGGGKFGVDTSKWGLSCGKQNFDDLLAAFRAAKDDGGRAGGGRAGWLSFLRGGADGAAAGAGSGSLDFVRGSSKDLQAAGGSGAKLPKASTVAGILNPADAKNKGKGDAVALSSEDLAGERERLARGAFAAGRAGGSSGGKSGGSSGGKSGGSSGVGDLSGGAFASSDFFSSGRSASGSTLSDKVKAGLAAAGSSKSGGSGSSQVGSANIQAGAAGKLSAFKAGGISTLMTSGSAGAYASYEEGAFVQLAAGNASAELAVAPSCAAEFAATNTGVVYDGNDPDGAGSGLLSGVSDPAFTVPVYADIPADEDPAKLEECMTKAAQCEEDKQPYLVRLGELQTQINDWVDQMIGACDDRCDCGPCNTLNSNIKNLCDGELKTTLDAIAVSCAATLPSYCADLGVTPTEADTGVDLCSRNMVKCEGYPWYGAACCWFNHNPCH